MYSLEEMKKLAAKGKMSRRDFVQMAVAAGATVVVASHELERAGGLADRIVDVIGGQVIDASQEGGP